MMYRAYQAQADPPWKTAVRRRCGGLALGGSTPWRSWDPERTFGHPRRAASRLSGPRRADSHARPDYRIGTVRVGNREAAVTEVPVLATPSARRRILPRTSFERRPAARAGGGRRCQRPFRHAPAQHACRPCSPTTTSSSPTRHNARDAARGGALLGFDDHVETSPHPPFLEATGPGGHVLAVCQPRVQALGARVAVMAEAGQPGRSRAA